MRQACYVVWVRLGISIAVIAVWVACSRAEAPPVLGELPDFQLVDQHGQPFGKAQMAGKVWVADFVFLGCSDVCPRLTERMKSLQGRSKAQLVTFSVDPANDTPERLAEYARAYGADPARWTFVTGPSEEVERAVVKGFKIAMGKEAAPAAEGKTAVLQIFHGEHFVLVDGAGRIRGYYDSVGEGMEKLLRDLSAVD
jgi:protein SCO1